MNIDEKVQRNIHSTFKLAKQKKRNMARFTINSNFETHINQSHSQSSDSFTIIILIVVLSTDHFLLLVTIVAMSPLHCVVVSILVSSSELNLPNQVETVNQDECIMAISEHSGTGGVGVAIRFTHQPLVKLMYLEDEKVSCGIHRMQCISDFYGHIFIIYVAEWID